MEGRKKEKKGHRKKIEIDLAGKAIKCYTDHMKKKGTNGEEMVR